MEWRETTRGDRNTLAKLGCTTGAQYCAYIMRSAVPLRSAADCVAVVIVSGGDSQEPPKAIPEASFGCLKLASLELSMSVPDASQMLTRNIQTT